MDRSPLDLNQLGSSCLLTAMQEMKTVSLKLHKNVQVASDAGLAAMLLVL